MTPAVAAVIIAALLQSPELARIWAASQQHKRTEETKRAKAGAR